jgi:hypothetical protein
MQGGLALLHMDARSGESGLFFSNFFLIINQEVDRTVKKKKTQSPAASLQLPSCAPKSTLSLLVPVSLQTPPPPAHSNSSPQQQQWLPREHAATDTAAAPEDVGARTTA